MQALLPVRCICTCLCGASVPVSAAAISLPALTCCSGSCCRLTAAAAAAAAAAGESDEVKRIFLEGNPYFLALTMAVSLLHSGG